MPHFRSGATTMGGGLMLLIASAISIQAQSASDYAVRLSAAVQSSPARITLSWPGDAAASSYQVYRKSKDATSWSSLGTLAGGATEYVDANVTLGGDYEYRVSKAASTYTGEGYIYCGIEVPLVEERGKLVLVVDNTHAAALALELVRLEMDLVGDGWTVLRHDVARDESVDTVRSLIRTDYNADRNNVKAVLLFGHVPVPYSGNLNPDGHDNHQGAWPADVYYGELTSMWRDVTVDNTTASDPRNQNVPGDGKFDPTSLPSNTELQVGRVDLSNLPAFGVSELELLRRYLNKDHRFRHKQVSAAQRGLVDDHFGSFNGEAFAVGGWRSFATFFGASNTYALDWTTTLAQESYLWGYGCGSGSYTSASGVTSTSLLAGSDPRVVFTMLFGSYFGDWDISNNLLRAALATPTYTLTCAWSGRPHWHFHHMALGETVGYSARWAQNNSATYSGNYGERYVHVALMGDPTLRLHPLSPPSGFVVATNDTGQVLLSWNASADEVAGYAVYSAPTLAGPFTRTHSGLLLDTHFTMDAKDTSPDVIYMVRAVTLQTSASGSYYNASQGVYGDVAGSFLPPTVTIAVVDQTAILSWPATGVIGYHLESTSSLNVPDWLVVTNSIQTSNAVNWVTVGVGPGSAYFRLTTP